jgi:hypothetical protein
MLTSSTARRCTCNTVANALIGSGMNTGTFAISADADLGARFDEQPVAKNPTTAAATENFVTGPSSRR